MKKNALYLFTFFAFLIIPIFTNAAAPIAGQAGYWKLDELSGSQANDTSGNGTTGNLMNNPVWSSGKLNGSLSFDGVDDYVNLGDANLLKPKTLTVSAWVKRNGAQNDWVKILNKGRGDAAPYASYKLEFNGTSDTVVNFHLGFTDGTAAVVQNSTPLADGVWTHLVGTFDGTTIRLYVNGVLESTNVVGSKAINYDTIPLTFGGYAGWGYFKGNIDEVRIYNRALSDSEVSALYTSVLPVNSNLEVYPGPGNNAYKSDLYNVEVYDGNNWLPAYVYKVSDTSVTHWYNGQTPSVNFLTFGTNSSVNVRVSKVGGSITSAQISPKSKGINANIVNGQATFNLNVNNKTWITINNDDANPLFIFADELKPSVPQGATYFGPGVHTLAPSTSNHYYASNNETIYLDGGAWVRGNIISKGKTNVKIMGPGVLSGELWNPATIQKLGWDAGFRDYFMINAADYGVVGDTDLRGITIVDSPAYNVYNVKNAYSAKVLSPWYFQTDGFNGVNIDNVFAFNGDTTFNNYMGYWDNATNGYTVNTKLTNSFGGTTNNAVILGGFYGNHSSANFTSTVDNLDIKTYNTNNFVQYGAPHEPSVFQVWVDNNDSSYGFKNQIYQNIRIEGNVNAPLMQLQNRSYPTTWGGSTNPKPLGNSYNITFKNITLEGQQLDGSIGKKSEIAGLDANNGFHNVLLENVSIGGTVINQSNISNYIDVNPYVWGLSFSPTLTLSFSANPTSVNSGQPSTLTWSSTNATSCTASGAWSGTKATTGSQQFTPSATSNYILTCVNANGANIVKNVTISVNTLTPDTIPPIVTMTAPVSGSSVSGSSVVVSANATDNVGVVGVQFKLDGVNLSGEILSMPYQVNWNSTSLTSGSHTISAVARDQAGNTASSSVVVTVATMQQDTSLLGHWKFDSTSGTVATDSSANNNSGTLLNGPTWVAGKFGNGLSFDGVNDYVNLGNPTNLIPGSQLTLSGWVNVSDTSSTQVLVAKDNDGSNSTFLRVQSGGKVRCNIGGTNGGVDYGNVPTNTWTHLACTYDGATARVYINGVQVGSFAKTGTIANNPNNWNIGARVNGAQLLLKGLIDDVRIYSKALSATEVGSLAGGLSIGGLPSASNPQIQNKFITGDAVKTTATVNVRQTANGTKLGTQSTGVSGTVLGGPIVSGGYTWWNINFTTGVDGWVAEMYVSKTSPVAFIGTLQVGSVGEEVSMLQSTLKKLGYYTNGITGYFGELTKSAVSQFQTANSLEAVGIVGPKTRALLQNQ